MKMKLVLCVTVLFGCSQGKPLVRHPSEGNPKPTLDLSTVKPDGCRGPLLQDIPRLLLEGLNLEQAPRGLSSGLAGLRERWMVVLNGASMETKVTSSTSAPESFGSENYSIDKPPCCQLLSQISIKDLGWDDWIVYPESFNLTQCAVCATQSNSTPPRCLEHNPGGPQGHEQTQCCGPTSHERVQFIYFDKFNTLTIASVYLPRECGCRPNTNSPS